MQKFVVDAKEFVEGARKRSTAQRSFDSLVHQRWFLVFTLCK